MRKIDYIVVHCTATGQDATIDAIKRYWREKLKWKSVGYHYIIEASGKETQLQSIAHQTNGVKGHNANSIHVCYVGGVDKQGNPIDNRTDEQKKKLITRLSALRVMFPNAVILGHRDFKGVAKACPSFDAKTEYRNI